jgi:nickel/cobalt transporter (NiCoT) family protein
MFANFRRVLSDTTPGLRPKVIGIYTFLISLNIALWVVTLLSSLKYPLLLPVAATAYGFGLRHAVDADHISAIDNVTRKLMQEKKKPVAVGFFFSLGHSSVVFIMATLIAAGSAYISGNLANDKSPLKTYGGLIGTSVSALFLFAIAVINIIILVQIFQTFRNVTRGTSYNEAEVDDYLNKRGFFARIFRPLFKTIDKSWKMYPVGFLFGLGFDTATEIALLASAGAFATQSVPFWVVMLLPLLFTAGMSLADTTDGVLMLGAYGWAFVKPIRKLFYNMSITLISVLVALVVGALETLNIVSNQLNLSGGVWDFVGNLNNNFGTVGAAIIVIFLLSWVISTIIYRIKKYDDLEVVRTATPSAAGD